jgi:hypothetical protein
VLWVFLRYRNGSSVTTETVLLSDSETVLLHIYWERACAFERAADALHGAGVNTKAGCTRGRARVSRGLESKFPISFWLSKHFWLGLKTQHRDGPDAMSGEQILATATLP